MENSLTGSKTKANAKETNFEWIGCFISATKSGYRNSRIRNPTSESVLEAIAVMKQGLFGETQFAVLDSDGQWMWVGDGFDEAVAAFNKPAAIQRNVALVQILAMSGEELIAVAQEQESTMEQPSSKYQRLDIPLPLLDGYTNNQINQILKDEMDNLEHLKAREIAAGIHRLASEKRVEYLRNEIQNRLHADGSTKDIE